MNSTPHPGLDPDSVEDLRQRTRAFIRGTVMPAEPRPGQALNLTVRRELAQAAREAGVFAPQVAVEFGGQGLDLAQCSPVFQEAGYSPIGPAVLNCMAPDEGNMHMLAMIGTPEQKRRFLAPLAAGDISSCFAMSEPHPGAGSDPQALATTAVRDGSGWRIDGHKRFTSGATFAGFVIVMARTGEDMAAGRPARDGATMFLVPMDAPGVRLGAPIHTTDRYLPGGHPHVHFDGVQRPRLGRAGRTGPGVHVCAAAAGTGPA